ncbi:MAG: MBL fold metallo-hydrolase [Candidatus Xenobia bacterium]
MEIEYVTHASLMLRSGGRRLLTDPFYWFDDLVAPIMTHFPPRPLKPQDFGHIDYLFSSHIHPDHSHPETLKKIRDQVGTVLLPAERPGLLQRYRDLGFTDLRLLPRGETLRLDDGLEVTSYWSDPIDSCLVATMDGVTVLHSNDCLLSFEATREVAARHRIDYACVLYTSAQELYPYILPRTSSERERLGRERERDFLRDQLRRLEILKPQHVVPYSMTMTYHRSHEIHLNGYGRLIPPQFAKAVPALVVQPGDVLENGRLHRYREENLWGETEAEFLANITGQKTDGPAFDAGRVAAVAERLEPVLEAFLHRDLADCLPVLVPALSRVQLSVFGTDGKKTWLVSREARRVTSPPAERAIVEIDIPASLLEALLDGFYDPYSLLFLHQMRFRLNGRCDDDRTECALYISVVLMMLCESWKTLIQFEA